MDKMTEQELLKKKEEELNKHHGFWSLFGWYTKKRGDGSRVVELQVPVPCFKGGFSWQPGGFNATIRLGHNTEKAFSSVMYFYGTEYRHPIDIYIAIPFLFNLYFELRVPKPTWFVKWMGKRDDLTLGIYHHCGYTMLYFLHDEMDDYNDKAKRRKWSIDWHDVLKGQFDTDVEELSFVHHRLDMPAEGNYPAIETYVNIKTFKYLRRYKRWWIRNMVFYRTDIEVPEGMPKPEFQGKGENGWDQGVNFINSLSYPGLLTAAEAINRYKDEVRSNRKKYG